MSPTPPDFRTWWADARERAYPCTRDLAEAAYRAGMAFAGVIAQSVEVRDEIAAIRADVDALRAILETEP